MKPTGWTREWVRLRCAVCGAVTQLTWSGYLTALEHGSRQSCAGCGAEQIFQDRRQMHLPVERERRLG